MCNIARLKTVVAQMIIFAESFSMFNMELRALLLCLINLPVALFTRDGICQKVIR